MLPALRTRFNISLFPEQVANTRSIPDIAAEERVEVPVIKVAATVFRAIVDLKS